MFSFQCKTQQQCKKRTKIYTQQWNIMTIIQLTGSWSLLLLLQIVGWIKRDREVFAISVIETFSVNYSLFTRENGQMGGCYNILK